MNYKQNKEILLSLLRATTSEEVTHFIETHEFFKNCKWRFYGDKENNAGFIKAQSPDPVGALVEKITNGIDAVLIRKCWQGGLDPTSNQAPKTMNEAIRKFFGNNVAEFKISDKEIREIADKTTRIIAEGETERPTISIIDFGEGQHPKDFPKTLLSLGESNKIKIKFVHGIYNQGGSAALKFCSNGYQLILSRRAPEINNGKETDYWGFALIREHFEEGYRAEWYEYCVIETPNGLGVPYFPYEPLECLPGGEIFDGGTYIRMYGYIMKNPQFFITGQREGELAREINKRYFAMPLPILLQEQRTQLPRWEKGKNDKTRIYGFWRLIKKQLKDKKIIRTFLPLKAELGIFGLRTIEILIISDESELGSSYRKQNEKVFLTVNGQVQHFETLSFLKTECLLPDLAPYLIIHINLSDAGRTANKLFNTARTTLIDLPQKEIFRQRLINSIKGDETLKELNEEYKKRKLEHAQPEDKDLSRFIGRLVKDNPFLSALLKLGEEVPTEKPEGPKKEYIGKYIPTIFEIIGEDIKGVPYNRYGWIRIKTDAVNDYLIRDKDRGELKWTPSPIIQISQHSLRNGVIPFRIDPVGTTKPGDATSIIFELTRPGQDSLKAELKINIEEYAEAKISPPGKPREPSSLALKLPRRVYVPPEDWPKHEWTSKDIAKVEQDQNGITVYINKEPDVLTEFPKRNPRFTSGDMMASIRKRYFASIYLYAIAMFFEMENKPEEREWVIPTAMKAISRFVLDLAFTQRMSENLEE